MQIKVLILLFFLVLVLSTGCDSIPEETTINETTVTQTTSSNSSVSLEELKTQLLKTGSVFVPDVKMASALTGYSVATPSFIPEGFMLIGPPGAGGVFRVFKLGDPAQIEGVKYPYSVEQEYIQGTDYFTKGPRFHISQSRNRISGAKGEPVKIGKYEGEKAILSNQDPPRLVLTWNDGIMYYVMSGLLLNPLNEDTLIKIAASMKY